MLFRSLVLTALAVVALLVPAGTPATATPTDEAETSQTIWVAWKMPGPFLGYATWPQTYLPDGVPACGEGGVQVDEYKYGTEGIREKVHALLDIGVLNSPADDSRVATRQYYFVELKPCDPGQGQVPPEVIDPVVQPGTQGTPTPATAPTAVLLQPAYTG